MGTGTKLGNSYLNSNTITRRIQYILHTGHKLNIFKRRSGPLLNVLCTFNLRMNPRSKLIKSKATLESIFPKETSVFQLILNP